MTRCIVVTLWLSITICFAQTTRTFTPEKRILFYQGNMIQTADVEALKGLMERAASAGYTDVMLSDPKANTYFIMEFKDTWEKNVTILRDEASRLGLGFNLTVLPYGYCTGLLAHNPNLVEGTPVKDAPLQALNGQLAPVSTTSLANPSFEEFEGNELAGWSFQDTPGDVSYVDQEIVKDGQASIRFENFSANEYGLGRVLQELEVQPFKQYRLSAWVRMENLTARLNALVKTETERDLLSQDFVLVGEENQQTQLQDVENQTLEWTKFSWAFNSLDNTNIKLIIGAYGGSSGKLWLDGLTVEDVPTLNLVRRDDLPINLYSDETTYVEEADFARLEDESLGMTSYAGKYGVFHEPPVITLTDGSGLQEGETVYFSGYHAQLVPNGHVTCSLSNEDMFAVSDSILGQLSTFNVDGFMLMHSEIRAGGWEPQQASYEPTGKLLGTNIQRLFEMAQQHTSGNPTYIWGDMLDPNHNAREYYYQMRGSLEQSWADVPKDLRIVTWWENEKLKEKGARSLQFFSEQGFKQIIAGYYDKDIEENYRLWQEAARGVTGIEGVMYTTWVDDYSNLERFAELWWGE